MQKKMQTQSLPKKRKAKAKLEVDAEAEAQGKAEAEAKAPSAPVSALWDRAGVPGEAKLTPRPTPQPRLQLKLLLKPRLAPGQIVELDVKRSQRCPSLSALWAAWHR